MGFFLDLACIITLASWQHVLLGTRLVNLHSVLMILRSQALVVQPNVLKATLEVSTPGFHAVTCREPANIRHIPCLHADVAQGTVMPSFRENNMTVLQLYSHHIVLSIGDMFGLGNQRGVRAVNGNGALLQVDCQVWIFFPLELQQQAVVLERAQQK